MTCREVEKRARAVVMFVGGFALFNLLVYAWVTYVTPSYAPVLWGILLTASIIVFVAAVITFTGFWLTGGISFCKDRDKGRDRGTIEKGA